MSDIQKQLIDRLNKAENIIANKARQSQANYIIMSSEASDIFRKLKLEEERRKLKKERREKLDELIKKTSE